jgi:integrase
VASIERRKNKRGIVSWRVAWREGGARDGRRESETCDSERVARKFAAFVEAAGEARPEGYPKGCRGRTLAPAEPSTSSAAPTLGAVVSEYVAQLRKAEEQQKARYMRLFEQHVRTAVVSLPDGSNVGPLGGLPIDTVTSEVVDAWVAWMTKRTYVSRRARKKGERDVLRGYSAKTIHNIHGGVISPAFGYATRKYSDYAPTNPCTDVELPEKNGKSVNLDQVPTGDEIDDWVRIGYEVSILAGDIIVVAAGTGLRWSELTALRPLDLDLKRGLLTVSQTLKQDGERHWYIAPYGKSDAALRTIRIPGEVVEIFRRRIRKLGRRDLIFRGTRGGFLNSSSWYSKEWPKVMALASAQGITTNVSIHKFRHSHATMLLANNVSLDTVSKRLGHTSIAVTSKPYGHFAPEADQRAVEVLDGILNKPRRCETAT